MDDLPADLGKRFRAAREYAGLSNANEVARQLKWSPSNYGRLERGERQLKSWEADSVLPKMADICGLPTDWFTAPWGQTLERTTHPDEEPEWVGRIEDQLTLILGVLRARADQSAEEAMGQIAAPADDRRKRQRRTA